MVANKIFDTSIIPDLPAVSGSLTDYRKLAKFDWKLLRVFFEGEARLKVKYAIWNSLENEKLFQRQNVTPSVDNQKKLAALRMKRVIDIGFLPDEIKNSRYQRRVKEPKL